jgi:prophage antirepressor-like protein
MSNVSIYKFEDTAEIRVVEIEGNHWFLAKDALAGMGYPQTSHANILKKLADDEVILKQIQKGVRSVSLISESGLYKLVMRSDKPEAQRFQDWVTRDVLPAIRKDGAYIMGEEKVATGEMDEDAFVLKAIEILQRKIDRLKAENDAMSQELNVLTVDEYRALTQRYFTHSQKVKLGQAAARILRAQGQEPQRQERTVRSTVRSALSG